MKKLILSVALSMFALALVADDAAKDKSACPASKDKTCCPAGKKEDKAGCDKAKSDGCSKAKQDAGSCKEKKECPDKAKDTAKK